jgi:hypothetical protein
VTFQRASQNSGAALFVSAVKPKHAVTACTSRCGSVVAFDCQLQVCSVQAAGMLQ